MLARYWIRLDLEHNGDGHMLNVAFCTRWIILTSKAAGGNPPYSPRLFSPGSTILHLDLLFWM
jgi:hypothetical protein